ncbi:hypothetical protein LC76P1_00106 [Lysinibacillus phage LC76P1]|nr:hypothetical protein LC76P1_00106 [Lysinibacillus phage LC76P1]
MNSLYLVENYEAMIELGLKFKESYPKTLITYYRATPAYVIIKMGEHVTIITFGDNMNNRDLRGYEPFTVFNATVNKEGGSLKPRTPEMAIEQLKLIRIVKDTLGTKDNREAFDVASRMLLGYKLSDIIREIEDRIGEKPIVTGKDTLSPNTSATKGAFTGTITKSQQGCVNSQCYCTGACKSGGAIAKLSEPDITFKLNSSETQCALDNIAKHMRKATEPKYTLEDAMMSVSEKLINSVRAIDTIRDGEPRVISEQESLTLLAQTLKDIVSEFKNKGK